MTTEVIAAIFAGLVITIPLIGGILVKLFEIAKAAKTTKDLTILGDKKIDNITVLVDGRYSEILKEVAAGKQENADIKMLLAQLTGKSVDMTRADMAAGVAVVAQVKYEEQRAHVEAATVVAGVLKEEVMVAKKESV